MKLPEPPHLRELNRANEQEYNLVLAGWLRTYVGTKEKPSSVNLTIERSVMYRLYQPVVKEIIERSNVVVACLADARDAVLGWVAFEGLVVHYICVKPRWQRLGVATFMLCDFAELRDVMYTHKTSDGSKLPIAKGWEYHPMGRFEGS